MKKIFILLLITVICGCSKSDPTPGLITIQYKFTANVSSTYTITYNGIGDDFSTVSKTISFTGTSWSVSFPAAVGDFDEAMLDVTCTATPTPTLNGKLSIYNNGKDETDGDLILTPTSSTTNSSIYYIPFMGK